jgi:hypothetical protein
MKKLVYLLVISLFLVALVVPHSFLLAANDVELTDDVNITLTDPSMTLVLANESTFSSMTVTASTIAITVSAGGSITLSSSLGYLLTNDQEATISCPGSGQTSSVTYNTAGTITFTPSLTKCWLEDNPTYNPGGGGGGGAAPPAPTPPEEEVPSDESIGEGETTSDLGAGESGNVGEVSHKGANVLMGEEATANFNLSSASGGASGSHNLKVQNITGNQATITISSDPVVFTLLSGNSKNVDIDGDGYRDMTVTLNRITDGKADLTVTEIKVVKIESVLPGSLVKIASKTAVYYLGEDSQRYVFPNEKVYYSWYNDFSNVMTISDEDMAKLPIGGLVTYRPGTRMVTFTTTVDVYAVIQGGILRKLRDEAMAEELYGIHWNQHIDDVNDAFYTSYGFGDDLATSDEYNKETQKAYSPTITEDKSI